MTDRPTARIWVTYRERTPDQTAPDVESIEVTWEGAAPPVETLTAVAASLASGRSLPLATGGIIPSTLQACRHFTKCAGCASDVTVRLRSGEDLPSSPWACTNCISSVGRSGGAGPVCGEVVDIDRRRCLQAPEHRSGPNPTPHVVRMRTDA